MPVRSTAIEKGMDDCGGQARGPMVVNCAVGG